MRTSHCTMRSLISFLVRCAVAFILASAAASANAGPNQAPSVTLTSPANGASYMAPAAIALAATASDPDGTVVRVDFYSGTTLIGTATTAPYTATWSNVPAGTYSISAKATDNNGKVGTSSAATVTVASATALVITSPADGEFFSLSGTVSVSGTYEGPTTGNTILIDTPSRSRLAIITDNSYVSYAGSPVLGYDFTLGPNTLTVRLERADLTSVTRSITIHGYDTPVVAFTAPSTATFTAPANVTFAVDAVAPGGAVTQVEFRRNGTPVGTLTSPPYQVTLSNLANGTYTIQAFATSNRGPIGNSSTTIQVLGPNTPPVISITSPASGTIFSQGSNVPITVAASDPDGSVTMVEYFANASPIGTTNVAPFGFTWINPAAGSYALTARATDNRGGQTTSAPVNITISPPNQPPAVSLTAPSGGSTFPLASNVTLSATASDSDGTISKVEFYTGATLIGTRTTAPYSIPWTAMTPGANSLTAKAFDNLNASTVSAPVNVTVTGAVTYLHNDFAGNPIAATDASGAIVWKENFRPYGDRLNNQPAASGNRQWFHGKPVDSDTGLSYFGARYYDATLGRFMGVDAEHFAEDNLQSFNRYSYGNSNPHKFVDPDGHLPIFIPFLAKGLAVAASLVGAYMTGYEAGTVAYNVGTGQQSVGSAVADAAPGIAVGIALGGAGKLALRSLSSSALEKLVGSATSAIPRASNARLQNAIDALFQSTDKIPGGTAGAIRHEMRTGEKVGGKTHTIKGQDRARQLDKILSQEKLNDSDRALAEQIRKDLRDALNGN